ncbi:acyl-CoA dehydrogenase family protein [Halobacteriales archaeon Cl-PHB]
MDFTRNHLEMLNLTEEQSLLVQTLHEMAESEFAERAYTWQGEFPWENVELLADRDFLGINLSEEYGGGGYGEFEAMLAIEAVGTVCPETAYAMANLSLIAPRAVDMFGSEAAKERYLPPICRGETAMSIAISEPHAGSDAAAMNTHVEREDGDLYLSGEKIWVSGVPESDAAVVWARFPDGHLGTVIMEFDAPGVDINEHYKNMAGFTQTHFFMEDVRIPRENVLVDGKRALKKQLKALNWERCGTALAANISAQCAFDLARDYMTEREQFGQQLQSFQGMRWKLANMATDLEVSRTMTYRAIQNAEAHGRVPDRLETSIAKLFAARTAEEVISEALQTFGATGYQQGHPLEYLYRLQRGRRIAAGTDEIMLNNIADTVFEQGLPSLA